MCLGIPGRVTAIDRDGFVPVGTVDFNGVTRSVCLSYVADEVAVGDYVIVHVGFAISKVDETEAKRTYDVLVAMSGLDELEWESELGEPAAVPAPEGA